MDGRTVGNAAVLIIKDRPLARNQNGADTWHPVLHNNLVVSSFVDNLFDHAASVTLPYPVSQGGAYTWPINAVWSIEGTGTRTSLTGWTSQIHTMKPDGTMTVQKLNHSVIRSASQTYGSPH